MARPPAYHPIRILIAEGNPVNAGCGTKGLQSSHLLNKTEIVANGLELFERLDALPPTRLPELILLDLDMPLLDGRETLRQLKAHPRYRHIPVVMLITSQKEQSGGGHQSPGADAYIVKPLNAANLLETILGLNAYRLQIVTPSMHPDSLW